MHGHRSPPADIVISDTQDVRAASETPRGVVDCNAEKVEF